MGNVSEDTLLILIAPNVSEQMGGEAIKALQIYQEIKKLHPNTIQITHERNKKELSGRLNLADVYYVPDTSLSLLLWRSRVFAKLLDPWFCAKAVRLAEAIAYERGLTGDKVLIHQTEPNSPVIPRTISKKHRNVFGPINGNIYYPRIFQHKESLSAKLRRIFHFPLQRAHRLFFSGLRRADLILCAGGKRTRDSLLAAGCPSNIIVDSVDCGIKDEILARPRTRHSGTNLLFLHYGRTFHKGTFLIVQSLAKTKNRICIDVVGRGTELDRCRLLAEKLGVGDRINFLGWYEKHSDMIASLSRYRGALLPSLEDANGIVVQEAMAVGLPMICLDWGGPQLLVRNGVTGFLVQPDSEEAISSAMAQQLDELATNGGLAESMSLAARDLAEAWRWSRVAADWLSLYDRSTRHK